MLTAEKLRNFIEILDRCIEQKPDYEYKAKERKRVEVYLYGNYVKTLNSQNQAADFLKVSAKAVNRRLQGKHSRTLEAMEADVKYEEV